MKKETKKTEKKVSAKDKSTEDIKDEDSEKLEESELEEEVETEDIRFRELDSFLQSLSGFNQGVVNPVTNLERGVSGFRLSTREDTDEEKEVSYKSSKEDDNNHYQEVKEHVVEYRTLDSGNDRGVGIVSHDTGFEVSGSSWHRTDVRKSDENTESMSQKARVNYEIGEKKESIFESQDRKYKIRK